MDTVAAPPSPPPAPEAAPARAGPERPARDEGPARPRRARSLAGAMAPAFAIGLAVVALLAIGLALRPGLADGLLPAGGAEVVRLFFGAPATAWLTVAVFGLSAALGGLSFGRAGRRLALEERALGQAASALKGDPALLRARAEGDGDGARFFAQGSDAIPGLSGTAAFAMAETVAKDARTFRYEPVAMIVDRVAPQVLVGSVELRDVQQLGIRLGILGTFVGMTMALGRISGVFGPSGGAASTEAVGGVIESLSLGFGTSIAGLLAAVFLQVMGWGLRAREGDVLDALQETAAGIQALYRRGELTSRSLGASLDEVKKSLAETQAGIARHGAQISEGGERLRAAVTSAADAFAAPLGEIERTGERLAALLADQSGAVARLGEATRAVAGLQASAAAHLDGAMERAARAQREAAEALREEIRALSGAIAAEMRAGFAADRLREAPGEAANGASDQLARAAGLMEAGLRAQARAHRRVSALLGLAVLLLAAVVALLAWPQATAAPSVAAASVAAPTTDAATDAAPTSAAPPPAAQAATPAPAPAAVPAAAPTPPVGVEARP